MIFQIVTSFAGLMMLSMHVKGTITGQATTGMRNSVMTGPSVAMMNNQMTLPSLRDAATLAMATGMSLPVVMEIMRDSTPMMKTMMTMVARMIRNNMTPLLSSNMMSTTNTDPITQNMINPSMMATSEMNPMSSNMLNSLTNMASSNMDPMSTNMLNPSTRMMASPNMNPMLSNMRQLNSMMPSMTPISSTTPWSSSSTNPMTDAMMASINSINDFNSLAMSSFNLNPRRMDSMQNSMLSGAKSDPQMKAMINNPSMMRRNNPMLGPVVDYFKGSPKWRKYGFMTPSAKKALTKYYGKPHYYY